MVDILPTCNFFERQVSLTSQTLVSRAALIACQRRVVEVIGIVEQKEAGLRDQANSL